MRLNLSLRSFVPLVPIFVSLILASSAQAQSRGKIAEFFGELFGRISRQAAPVEKESAEVLEDALKAARHGEIPLSPYRQAIENGEILPKIIDDISTDPFNLTPGVRSPLSSSLRIHDVAVSVGSSSSLALANVRTAVHNPNIDVIALVGNSGSGKTHVIESLDASFRHNTTALVAKDVQKGNWIQRQFRRLFKRTNRASSEMISTQTKIGARNEYVIKIDTSHPNFRDIEKFKLALQNLFESAAFRQSDNSVIYLSDVSVFTSAGKEASGLRNTMDEYLSLITRNDHIKQGQDVKVIFESDQGLLNTLKQNSSFLKNSTGFRAVAVAESNSAKDINTIIRRNLAIIDPDGLIKVSDETLDKLASWIKRYAPGEGVAKTSLLAIQDVKAQLMSVLTGPATDVSDDAIKALEESLEAKNRQLVKAQSLRGAHARHLAEKIPGEIADLETRIVEAKASYSRLKEIRQQLLGIEAQQGKLTGEAAIQAGQKYKSLMSEAYQVANERYYATALSRITGASVADILKVSGKMTIKDLEKMLRQELVGMGQKPVIDELIKAAHAIERAFETGAHLTESRPASTILLMGPPATGKTSVFEIFNLWLERSEIVASAQLHSSAHVNQLLGSPVGYVGHGDVATLEKLFGTPGRAGVVFDEFDLSDKAVKDLISALLDPANVKTATGKQLHLGASLVAFTSNMGDKVIHGGIAKFLDEAGNIIEKPVTELTEADLKHIAASESGIHPRFFSRVKAIWVEAPQNEEILGVVKKYLRKFNQDQEIAGSLRAVEMTDTAIKKLSESIPAVGGDMRELRRNFDEVIESQVRQVLRNSDEVIRGPIDKIIESGNYMDQAGRYHKVQFKPGDLLEIDWNEAEGFVFRVAE